MRKLITLACLAVSLANVPLPAQDADAPNYEQIRQQINDISSPYYYPSLMMRFVQCDTLLTIDDYRMLYYGFPLREDYIPYQEDNQALLDSRRCLLRPDCTSDSCAKVIRVAQRALANNPFDLTALTLIPLCYQLMDSTDAYHLWDIKLHGILDAIYSSGDGETPQTAYHVIDIEHEYEILNRRHLELDQVKVEKMPIDLVTVRENPDSITGIYFNFGACKEVYERKYK